jgi:hypothetical protein
VLRSSRRAQGFGCRARHRLRCLVTLAALASVGLTLVGAAAGASGDGVASTAESPGCGVLDGDRGPLVGPSPYDPTFPYNALPSDTVISGPWADRYGRTIGEVRTHLVKVHLPGQAKDLWIHASVLPAFNRVLANLEAQAALGNVYEIRSDTWSFNASVVPGGRYLSFHAVGAAIDVNSTTNPYSADNVLTTDMPEWFVDAWRGAGWCWGGDWISVKDPMHFSYMGPINSAEDMPDGAPLAPVTTASGFTSILSVGTALQVTVPVSIQVAIDIDRDGAPEIVRVQESARTGGIRVEAAKSGNGFETCMDSLWSTAPPITPTAIVLGDATGDARPELWVVDTSGASVAVAVYRLLTLTGDTVSIAHTPELIETLTTGAPADATARFAVGDYDRDGRGDLFVVTPGGSTRIQVWQGPGFTSTLVDRVVATATDASWRFDLGDYDLDGRPDVYALSAGSPATLKVFRASGGFSGAPLVMTTGVSPRAGDSLSVEDYDGDGRDDIYLMNDNGSVRVILGGVPPAGSDPTDWFVDLGATWTWATGCASPANLRVQTNPPVPSQILIDGVAADSWGLTWLKLAPGSYQVSFQHIEGFTTPSATTVVLSEGQVSAIVGAFAARGFLRVMADPAVPSTIYVDGVPRDDWGMWTDLTPGDYQVCFGPVAGYAAPECQTATVTAGGTTTVTGHYTEDASAPAPEGLGMLRVTTNPAVPSQILVDGIPRDTWGLNWLKLPAGSYQVSFTDVPGFTTPAPQTVDVVEGVTSEATGDFAARGWLRVVTQPAVVGTVFVDGVPRNDWGMWTDLDPGQYQVCFGDVVGFVTPACQTATVTAGEQVPITGSYD